MTILVWAFLLMLESCNRQYQCADQSGSLANSGDILQVMQRCTIDAVCEDMRG